jgi:hypothetical protein
MMIEPNCDKSIQKFTSIWSDDSCSKFNISSTVGLEIYKNYLQEIQAITGL